MPLYALTGNTRVRALRDGPRRASCAECGAGMLARTGEVRIWHWAHRVAAPDCAAAGESAWHLAWKALGIDGTQEVRVGNRRADVLAPGGFAVEFQDWAIDPGELRAREDDWAGQGGMVWVFRADRQYAEGRIEVKPSLARFGDDLVKPENRATVDIRWSFAPARVRAARAPAFVDIGGGELLFVGAWRLGSSPLTGYGWRVTKESVIRTVLRGDVIPGPLAEDPAVVVRRIEAYVEAQREQRQRELAERLREASRQAVERAERQAAERRREAEERQREASRQWEASGGMAGFHARMRKLREAEAARGPAACDVCGREVEPDYAAELRKKSLPARHVLCNPGTSAYLTLLTHWI
jgi:hypothetical protein